MSSVGGPLDDRNIPPEELAEILVRRIRAGDRAAEGEMVETYQRGIRILLHFETRDREVARDLCQDTFLRAIEKIRAGDLREPRRLDSFLHGIARSLATAYYRKEGRRRTDADQDSIDRAAAKNHDPLHSVEQAEIRWQLNEAIDDLNVDRDRTLLRRHFFDDASLEQLSAELDVGRDHIYRLKYRAIKRLMDHFRGRFG